MWTTRPSATAKSIPLNFCGCHSVGWPIKTNEVQLSDGEGHEGTCDRVSLQSELAQLWCRPAPRPTAPEGSGKATLTCASSCPKQCHPS